MKLSVYIICYNEEKKIRKCLQQAAKIADEIVVVDSYSSDKTLEICAEFTDRIYQNSFEGFVAQKNFAVSKTEFDWVLNLDCDEVLDETVINEILKIKQNDKQEYSAYRIARKTFYVYRWLEHCWYPDYKIRLYKKDSAEWTGIKLHEKIEVRSGKTGILNGNILHYSFDSISDHLQTIDRFTEIAAEELIFKNKKVNFMTAIFHAKWIFIKIYFFKQGFRDGLAGLTVAFLSMVHVYVKYMKVIFKKAEN